MDIKILEELPQFIMPSKQDYILHIDSAFACCITKSIDEVKAIILKEKANIVNIKQERNFYGLKDYRIICK